MSIEIFFLSCVLFPYEMNSECIREREREKWEDVKNLLGMVVTGLERGGIIEVSSLHPS